MRQKEGWCDKRRCMLTSNCAMYGRDVWVVGGSVGGGSARKHQRAIRVYGEMINQTTLTRGN